MAGQGKKDALKTHFEGLLDVAVDQMSLTATTPLADVHEVFQNFWEMYVDDHPADADQMETAQQHFEAAFERLQAKPTRKGKKPKNNPEQATRRLVTLIAESGHPEPRDIEAMVKLVEKGADPTVTNKWGGNLFHMLMSACGTYGFDGWGKEVVDRLQAARVDINHVRTDGFTPLGVVADWTPYYEGHTAMKLGVMKYLIARGADPAPVKKWVEDKLQMKIAAGAEGPVTEGLRAMLAFLNETTTAT